MLKNNAVLEVEVKNILNNIKYLKQMTKKDICIPVKANCYGLGLDLVDFFIKEGYDFFAVSTLGEALELRAKNQKIKILLFGVVFAEELPLVLENDITITIYDFDLLNKIDQNIKFHLKIDTGMGRLGFLPQEIEEVVQTLQKKSLLVEGVYTHLSTASSSEVSQQQIAEFEKIVLFLKKDYDLKYIHLHNGLGSLKYPTTFDNLIRPGLITYGYFENYQLAKQYEHEIKPSTKLKVKVSHIKNYYGKIGYDGIDEVAGKIITVPIGYHDGMKQNYHGYLLTSVGKIVGKICMCQMMIQLNENNKIKKGQNINIWENNNIYQLAKYAKVSVYEILATLGTRITREYKE